MPRLLGAVVVAGWWGLSLGQPIEQAKGTLAITVSAPRQVTLGQPVVLWYVASNEARLSMNIDLGYDQIGRFTFTLTRPDGSVVAGRPILPRDGGSRTPILNLAVGEKHRRAIVLDEWVSFDRPGAYVLAVGLAPGSGPQAALSGTRQSIVVTPRDEKLIADRCRSLVDSLKATKIFNEAWIAAAMELNWTRDPVAVPYLEEALSLDVTPYGFDALIQIGTQQALDALTRLAQQPNPLVAQKAKNALARFKVRRL